MKVKKIGIVSLSSGMLGESFIKHELNIGLNRLKEYGIEVKFMPHSLKGIEYIKSNPQARSDDLINAFKDDSIDMILCAIGGNDTYRLLPYLFSNNELKNVVTEKIFLGFSDSTMNHLMLNKVGIKTFYGQSFLPDICELSSEILPYTRKYFEELITTGGICEIRPSDVWYKERGDFSEKGINVPMQSYVNTGFELINGNSVFEGEILGGCINSIYDIFNNSTYQDSVSMCSKYDLFPSLDEWKNKILLLETSQESTSPGLYKNMIDALDNFGIFNVVSGLLIGKPQNNIYYDEYKTILLDKFSNTQLPIVYNVNIGHCTPRCIIPFGVHAKVDIGEQVIKFTFTHNKV